MTLAATHVLSIRQMFACATGLRQFKSEVRRQLESLLARASLHALLRAGYLALPAGLKLANLSWLGSDIQVRVNLNISE